MGERLTKQELADEAWHLMVDYWFGKKGHGLRDLKGLGLTPGHLRLLMLLGDGESPTMSDLGRSMQVHASMCTWLVDGLEEKALVERRTLPSDRRAKLIVLTRQGKLVRARILASIYEPPPEFAKLDRAQLEALRGALRELHASGAEVTG